MLNGAIRELLITPRLGEQGGISEARPSVCSNYSGCLVLDLVDWTQGQTTGFDGRNSVARPDRRFEFLAEHYVFGNSWERLIGDYNVFRGRIWILVLLMNLFAPLWAFLQKQPV